MNAAAAWRRWALALTAAALAACEAPLDSSPSGGDTGSVVGSESTAPDIGEQPALNDSGVTWYVDQDTYTTTAAQRQAVTLYGTEPQALPDQDASQGRDNSANVNPNDGHAGFSFTKLDANGQALADPATPWDPVDRPWECVRDNVTGLTWEVKADIGIRGEDETYTWYDPDDTTNGGYAGVRDTTDATLCPTPAGEVECFTTKDYIDYINGLNGGQGLCGYADWRLPTMSELRSILNYNVTLPPDGTRARMADTGYFPHVAPEDYWSSQTVIHMHDGQVGDRAWQLHFDTGETTTHLKSATSVHVRLVRGRAAVGVP